MAGKNFILRLSGLFLLILLLAAVGFIAFRAANKNDDFHFRPQVRVSKILLIDKNMGTIDVHPTLIVSNDLPIEAQVRALQFELYFKNDLITKSRDVKGFVIKKQDTTRLALPMRIMKDDLNRLSDHLKLEREDSATFRLKMNFEAEVPVRGYRKFTFDKFVELPIVRVLTLASKKIEVEKFSFSHPQLQMNVRLNNPNNFRMTLEDCFLELNAGSDLKLSGPSSKNIFLPANGSEDITFHLKTHELKFMKFAWKNFFRDDKTQFHTVLSFQIKSANKTLDKARVTIVKDALLQDLKE